MNTASALSNEVPDANEGIVPGRSSGKVIAMRPLICRAMSVLATTAVLGTATYAQTAPDSPARQQPGGSGRVIVTITVLEGTVHTPSLP